ncbi:hypothetical protein RRG08_046449 [Elysia crispata]|uniref:Neurotransmitter-gated ion-channel ligand-binding domain-containing protein n=1 Tax=Elysia crispata TaxID=231223 RepID=A0AAE1CZD3_9GAST|nr:hypothetical protein RRG08_046449 [Elysia crispata]
MKVTVPEASIFVDADSSVVKCLVLSRQGDGRRIETWRDFRLEFHELIEDDYLELDSKLISRFWVPDLYFVNEKSSNFHDVTVPNTLLHLYSDGTVVFKMRNGTSPIRHDEIPKITVSRDESV